jgi:hypothetical protein
MAKPYAKRTLKVMEHFRKHPNAPVAEVAGKYNMAMSHAYRLRKQAKEQDLAAQGWLPPGVLPVPEVSRPIVNPEITMEPNETDVDQILGERGNRYGTFESNAKTCQLLKNVLHSQEGWYRLSYVQREAVEMMMHKISRLVNGDATYLDTVVDIAGYNQLMLEHMRDRNEGKKVE